MNKNRFCSLIAGVAAMGLAACNSDDSGESNDSSTGEFSLGITDGPVDSAEQVVVVFTGVSIKPADGDAIEFNFDTPKSIDLLQLQGSLSEELVSGETVTAGDYEWVRLHVTAEKDGVMDSFIELTDGSMHELWVPSGGETGLKLVSGFTVAAGGSVDFTVDFDLRKSVTNPRGFDSVILKPTLRLVDNIRVGSITGTVDATLVSEQCADATIDDGAVYVFAGADATPVDLQGTDSDAVTTALVKVQGDASYQYEAGFLLAGDYTVAYTCDAAVDDPATADSLTFVGAANVSVTSNTASTVDFQL